MSLFGETNRSISCVGQRHQRHQMFGLLSIAPAILHVPEVCGGRPNSEIQYQHFIGSHQLDNFHLPRLHKNQTVSGPIISCVSIKSRFAVNNRIAIEWHCEIGLPLWLPVTFIAMSDEDHESTWRTRTPYWSAAQRRGIIRAIGYHRSDYDDAVISFPPAEDADIAFLFRSFLCPVTTTLGALECLPIELLAAICLHLDLASLLKFGQVNTFARLVVNSIPEFKAAALYGLNAIRALLLTERTPGITLAEFSSMLRQDKCTLCNKSFATFVDLLSWTRTCIQCLEYDANGYRRNGFNAQDPMIVPLEDVRDCLGLSEAIIAQFPTMYVLPDRYSTLQCELDSDAQLTLRGLAWQAHHDIYGTNHSCPGCSEEVQGVVPLYAVHCPLPVVDWARGSVKYGISCAGCQRQYERWRHMPFWHPDRFCYRVRRDIVYTQAGLLAHLEVCYGAQAICLSSEDGLLDSEEIPRACRRGGRMNGNWEHRFTSRVPPDIVLPVTALEN